jgi:hypothetical protein
VRRILTILIPLVVSLALQSCDLFQTREPEPPTQSNSGFKQPVTSDIVLENLRVSVADANADNYVRCFSDTSVSTRGFTFNASSEVLASFGSLFNTWSIAEEQVYFRNLGLPQNAAPSLSFSNERQLITSSDSVIYSMDYLLFYPHRRSGIPLSVQGRMQLHIGTDRQGRWSIYRWQDFKSTTDSTWSYWKAIFSGS